MQKLAFLVFVFGFIAAVILPNEIGTSELPAVNGRVVAKARKSTVDSSAGGGFADCLCTIEFLGVVPTGRCQSTVSHLGPIYRNQQLSLPLLI